VAQKFGTLFVRLITSSLHSKKNLNSYFSDSRFGRDNVNIVYVKRSSNSLYRIIALNKLS